MRHQPEEFKPAVQTKQSRAVMQAQLWRIKCVWVSGTVGCQRLGGTCISCASVRLWGHGNCPASATAHERRPQELKATVSQLRLFSFALGCKIKGCFHFPLWFEKQKKGHGNAWNYELRTKCQMDMLHIMMGIGQVLAFHKRHLSTNLSLPKSAIP